MASFYPLKKIFEGFSKFEIVDDQTIRFFGPFLGGPFFLERVYGGHTFALAYLALKLFKPEIIVNKIQLNLLRPGNTDVPIIIKINFSSNFFYSLSIIQKNSLIATAQIRTVPSKSDRIKSNFKPIIKLDHFVDKFPILKDMKLLGIQPSVAIISEKRYNKEWLFEIRPIDQKHFFGKNIDRKPLSTFCKLSNETFVDKNLDPIIVILLLADFMIFQDFANICKFLGNAESIFGGSTLNFSANIHDIDGIEPDTQFYTENQFIVASQSKKYFSGKIFTISGNCLMTFCQENFTAFNPQTKK